MNACAALASTADDLAHLGGRAYLSAFGARVAGIRPGPLGYLDLVRGGRNRIRGSGFRDHLDDDSDGQARHFAGIAAAAGRIGPRPARWLSRAIGRDAAASADGRLTDVAIVFAAGILSGELEPAISGDWIRDRVCSL